MATYLVTGASGGIGCEYCRQLKERGDEVIAACRASSPDLDKLGVRVETGVDITSDAAVRGLAARLAGQPLDVLINNAGVLQSIPLDHLDFDSIRYQFEVNAIGTLRLTQALLPNLSEGSKLILMTSRMGSIGDNTSGGPMVIECPRWRCPWRGNRSPMTLNPGALPWRFYIRGW